MCVCVIVCGSEIFLGNIPIDARQELPVEGAEEGSWMMCCAEDGTLHTNVRPVHKWVSRQRANSNLPKVHNETKKVAHAKALTIVADRAWCVNKYADDVS